jgi:hypothetical protein
VREDGSLGQVIHCHHLRRAYHLGSVGKLPTWGDTYKDIAGTTVYLLSRDQARWNKPKSRHPHRMMVICNHCKKHVPAGRFGQHLHIHKEA